MLLQLPLLSLLQTGRGLPWSGAAGGGCGSRTTAAEDVRAFCFGKASRRGRGSPRARAAARKGRPEAAGSQARH
jgi:hypothetical protein